MVVVLVVASGAAWESPLLALVGERHDLVLLKRCVDVDDLLASASAGQADAAVVALDAPGLDHAAVDLLHRHQVRVVAVAGSGSPDAVQTRAARIGVDGLVGADDLARVVELLERDDEPLSDEVVEPETSAAAAATAGRVLVVWGPAGAPGRTTLSCGVAAALAARGLRTTLVDADPYGGSVAQHLGVLDEVSGLLSVARSSADGGSSAGSPVPSAHWTTTSPWSPACLGPTGGWRSGPVSSSTSSRSPAVPATSWSTPASASRTTRPAT